MTWGPVQAFLPTATASPLPLNADSKATYSYGQPMMRWLMAVFLSVFFFSPLPVKLSNTFSRCNTVCLWQSTLKSKSKTNNTNHIMLPNQQGLEQVYTHTHTQFGFLPSVSLTLNPISRSRIHGPLCLGFRESVDPLKSQANIFVYENTSMLVQRSTYSPLVFQRNPTWSL